MTQGDQANVRSPQQQNQAHNEGGKAEANATGGSGGNVTIIQISGWPFVVILLILLIAAVVYILEGTAPAATPYPTPTPIPSQNEGAAETQGQPPARSAAGQSPSTPADIPSSRAAASGNTTAQELVPSGGSAPAPTSAAIAGDDPFKPVNGGGQAGGEVSAASIGGPAPSLKGNILVCVPPDVVGRSTIHLWRLAADRNTWEEMRKVSVGLAKYNAATGQFKIDGPPVDGSSWGEAGQPYRLELWVDSRPVASIGDTTQGQPEFRVYPRRDNIAPDTFCR